MQSVAMWFLDPDSTPGTQPGKADLGSGAIGSIDVNWSEVYVLSWDA